MPSDDKRAVSHGKHSRGTASLELHDERYEGIDIPIMNKHGKRMREKPSRSDRKADRARAKAADAAVKSGGKQSWNPDEWDAARASLMEALGNTGALDKDKSSAKPKTVPESEKAPEPTSAAEPVQAAEPAQAVEPARAAEPAQVPKPARAAEPAQVPKPARAAKPAYVPEQESAIAAAKPSGLMRELGEKPETDEVIRFTDVYKKYQGGVHALDGVSFSIKKGEFVFLCGPSGAGKSTIIKLITCETRPSGGSVTVNGLTTSGLHSSKIPYLRRTLGVVFQDFRLIEKKSVYDNVAFAMKVVGAPRKVIFRRVRYVLELVGLLDRLRAKPSELSGGEQQRVAIARALVNNPSIIIADEPTGNLDPQKKKETMNLLRRVNGLGTTVLVVTHERELVDEMGMRVIHIDGGRIAYDMTGGYSVPGAADAGTAEEAVPEDVGETGARGE